jgi:hypothetical protein
MSSFLVGALVFLLSSAVLFAHSSRAATPLGNAPTYTIFATREGLVGNRTANGHIVQPRDRFVALPSPSVLSPAGSNQYQVRITYKGRSAIAPVWDVGPWNIQDDYWSPNRRYSDLPVGLPMAQAAYEQGYNGGRDEFGRFIGLPNGIDIADGTFWDDLGMVDSDWVQVSFLWLGNDPGPAVDTLSGTANNPMAANVPLEPPTIEEGAIGVDAGGAGYAAHDAVWYTADCGLNGSYAWTYSTTDATLSENWAKWTPSLPAAGFYEVKAYIPACGDVPATTAARYRIVHDGSMHDVTIDQAAAAGTWVSLGIYPFGTERAPEVFLNDVAGDSQRAVRFDALTWTPRTDITSPESQITAITRAENGFLIRWGASDDASGVASYDVQARQLPNGAWHDWLINTVESEAWFGHATGHDFAFRARARDWAGNQEAWHDRATMDTIGQ